MNKGNSNLIVILLILVVVLVGVSAASYYVLKSQGVDVAVNNDDFYKPSATNQPSEATNTSGISDKDDLNTLEKELDSTDTGSTDADLQGLDSQASGL